MREGGVVGGGGGGGGGGCNHVRGVACVRSVCVCDAPGEKSYSS